MQAGGTNIVSGLELAKNDSGFDNENRFIFLLSDGQDGQGMQRVHDYIDTVIADGISIYSLYIGNNADSIKPYYDNTEFKDTNIVGNDDIVNELINEFIEYLQVSIGLEDVIEDEGIRNTVNTFFENFDYKNTVIFKAIDMNVVTREDLNNFKKYAKALSDKVYMAGKSKRVCKITSPRDEESTAMTFAGPNLRLRQKPNYSIKTNMAITEMAITASNGTILNNLTTNIEEQKHLVSTLESQLLYGTNISLRYTIDFTNTSSLYDECDYITLICYLPDGFIHNINAPIIATGINVNNQTIPLRVSNLITMNSKNIANLMGKGLSVSPEVENYIKSNHTAIALRVYIKSDEFKLAQNETVRVSLGINKLLSANEDTTYQGNVEILEYQNEFFRRIQYQATAPVQMSAGNSELLGAIAGNYDKNEEDYVKTTNLGVVIPPTGKDKRLFKIYVFIGILLTIGFVIIREINIIKKNKDNK